MSKSFRIGRANALDGRPAVALDIDWDAEAATETFGIIGAKGSGKTTTARVIVEGLTGAGVQCVVIDPTGVWWGLKASRDGKREGLPFTVIGGLHGDIPLTPQAGPTVAQVVIDTTAPLVLDLSLLRKAEQRRFMLTFIDSLYHRSHGTKAIHLVVDECDLYVPQRVTGDVAGLVGAMEDIVRRGRVKGIGVSLISQRPASINKDVLTQVSVLIAHRIASPQDRKAVDAWVEVHADQDQVHRVMTSLHALPKGTAWFWSPEWLDTRLEQIAVRAPDTFDSSATPKAGQRQIVPQRLAQADVDALTAKMTEVVAEFERGDPGTLQRRIRALEAELAKLKTAQPPTERIVEVEKVVEVVPTWFTETVQEWINQTRTWLDQYEEMATEMATMIYRAQEASALRAEAARPNLRVVREAERKSKERHPSNPARQPRSEIKGNTSLPGPQRKLLTVLATYGPRTKRQLALQAGYSENGGGFNNPLGALRSAGYVTKGTPIEITDTGIEALGDFEPLPSGPALVAHWLETLPGPAAKILGALIERWPKSYTREELAAATGYEPRGGGFNNPLGKLRTLGLVTKAGSNDISLTDEFGEAIE